MTQRERGTLPILGWREWVGLPDLGVERIKAKVDTGARTSTLHAFFVDDYRHRGQTWVRFGIHPLQGRRDLALELEAPVVDQRPVKDSGGHVERRWIIRSRVCLGSACWPIELTLTNRDTMNFRMLLGRTAVAGRYLVDPRASYRLGRGPTPPSAD
jgi:hypothetical protein